MSGRLKIVVAPVAAIAVALSLGACGSQGVKVAASDHHGAVLFRDHCSGCHSLAVVGAVGSGFNVRRKARTNGPNFNVRPEQVPQVLYAIRNGGFSGAIMPENILLGPDAQAVAQFLAKYAGRAAKKTSAPAQVSASGTAP